MAVEDDFQRANSAREGLQNSQHRRDKTPVLSQHVHATLRVDRRPQDASGLESVVSIDNL